MYKRQLLRRGDERRVVGEAEVVVAAEGENLAAVDDEFRLSLIHISEPTRPY